MQFSLKYILALTAGLSLSPLHAEMVQSSSLTNDVEGSNLAARVLSKDSQNFNSRFSNVNSLSITESSGDKVRRQTIAAKIDIPEEEPSVIEKLNTVASNTVRKFSQTGVASWYGRQFHGRKTASGERFNMNALTVAHKTLPFGTKVEFTCASTGKKVVAKVNDRGPYVHGRSFDLSYSAAKALGILDRGVAKVTYRILD